jgi:hypothetical protein
MFGVGNSKRPATLTQGRFPANVILNYDEDSYTLKSNITKEELAELSLWMNENT